MNDDTASLFTEAAASDDPKWLRAKATQFRAIGRRHPNTGDVFLIWASRLKQKAQRIERKVT